MKVLLGAAILLGLVGCGDGGGPRELDIVSASVDEVGNRLTLTIRGCNPDGLGVSTEETPDGVTVSVTADALADEDCVFTQVLALADPLGPRQLRNGNTGGVIPVTD